MSRCIAADFFDRPMKPEHMHGGFCFLDTADVQHGPSFPDLVSAVAWLCEQPDDLAVRIGLVPETVLRDD